MKLRALFAPFSLGILFAACGGGQPEPAASHAATVAPPSVAPPRAPTTPKGRRAPKAPVALEEYYKIRRMPPFSRSSQALASFSHDDKLVAYASDEGGRLDVWVKPLADDGKPTQVTHVDGFVHSFAFSPKEDLLVFETDRGGDELPRLFATDSKGATPRELVPELPQGRRTTFVEWADDGKTFLYLSSARDEKYLDLVEYDLKAKKSTILWQASGKLAVTTTNKEHNRFILKETHSDANSDLWLFDRSAKAPVLITEHTGDIVFEPQAFTKDGKTLYVASDQGGEFRELFTLDLATKKRQSALKESWDVDGASFSETYKYFLTSTNEDGTPKVVATDTTTKKAIKLPDPGNKAVYTPLAFSRTDRYLAAALVSDQSPSSVQVIDMTTLTAKPIGNVLPPSLQQQAMIAGESVKVPSFDGRSVPAFLYKPTTPGPHPAIIDVHGGPTSQSRRTFSAYRQYFLSKGWAVLVPNVRGSTGYGKTYTKLDNLDLGGGPLKDVVACKKWLVEHASVDASQVVVMGGSYGGYMALVAEAFTPDEFAANVDFFGVSDLKTLVESFPAYWANEASYIHQKFGDPKNPAHAQYQHDRSPAHFVGQMKRPLLVVQGDKDARVKKDQSDRIVDELKRRKVPVHYLVLENEGHGFTKTENNLKAYALTDRFLDRYVLGDDSITDLH
jgi:dipeptidyl aminopeptidase/acylaminoacyl peptidase